MPIGWAQTVGQLGQGVVGDLVVEVQVGPHVSGDRGNPSAVICGRAQPVGLPGDSVPICGCVDAASGTGHQQQVRHDVGWQERRQPEERRVQRQNQQRVGGGEHTAGQDLGGVAYEAPEAVQATEADLACCAVVQQMHHGIDVTEQGEGLTCARWANNSTTLASLDNPMIRLPGR